MNSDVALYLLAETLKTAALIVAPVLLSTLIVGVAISIVQVATQIQEMTLTFVPKLGVAAVTLLLFGHWMLSVLDDYARHVFAAAAHLGY